LHCDGCLGNHGHGDRDGRRGRIRLSRSRRRASGRFRIRCRLNGRRRRGGGRGSSGPRREDGIRGSAVGVGASLGRSTNQFLWGAQRFGSSAQEITHGQGL
jgi:hypothetical protein